MRALRFVVPGALDTPTGGYGYDRRLVAGLPAEGWAVTVVALAGGWPFPDGHDRAAAARRARGHPRRLAS